MKGEIGKRGKVHWKGIKSREEEGCGEKRDYRKKRKRFGKKELGKERERTVIMIVVRTGLLYTGSRCWDYCTGHQEEPTAVTRI